MSRPDVWCRPGSHFLVCSKVRDKKRFRYSLTYIDDHDELPAKKICVLSTTVQAPEIVGFQLARCAIEGVVDFKNCRSSHAHGAGLQQKFCIKVSPFPDPIWINEEFLSPEALAFCRTYVLSDLDASEHERYIPFPSYTADAEQSFPCIKSMKDIVNVTKTWNERVYFGSNVTSPCCVYNCISCDERHFYTEGVVKKISELDFAWNILRDNTFNAAHTCIVAHNRHGLTASDLEWTNDLAISKNGIINKDQVFFCKTCFNAIKKQTIPKFSLKNNYYQKPIPDVLQELTWAEQALISPYRMCVTITKLRPMMGINSKGMRGNCAVIPHKVPEMTHKLPQDLVNVQTSLKVLFTGSQKPARKDVRHLIGVSVRKIISALRYLRSTCEGYKDLDIDDHNLQNLQQACHEVDNDEFANVPHCLYERCLAVDPKPDEELDNYTTDVIFEKIDADVKQPPSVSMCYERSALLNTDQVDVTSSELDESVMPHALAETEKTAEPTGYWKLTLPSEQRWINEYEDKYLLVRTCPTLFYDERIVPKDNNFAPTWVKHLLSISDPKFRQHNNYAFWMFNMLQRRSYHRKAKLMLDKSSYVKHLHDIKQLTPAEIQKAMHLKVNKQQSSNPKIQALMKALHSIGGYVPGSSFAKSYMRREVYGLIARYGLPTLFVTLNPEPAYHPLFAYYAGHTSNMAYVSNQAIAGFDHDIRKLVKLSCDDPVAASMFFHALITSYQDIILGCETNDGVFGPIAAYYAPFETQMKGTLHTHMLIWLKNTPTPNEFCRLIQSEEYKQRMTAWLDSVIHQDITNFEQCVRDEKEEKKDIPEQLPPHSAIVSRCPPNHVLPEHEFIKQFAKDVVDLVPRVNTHNHSFTCYKNKTKDCRFGFPRKQNDTTIIEDNGIVKLQRKSSSLNNYNPVTSVLMRHNTDIRLLMSGPDSLSTALYATDYSTKKNMNAYQLLSVVSAIMSNTSLTPDSSEKDVQTVLLKILHRLPHLYEKSIIEVVHLLFGRPERYTLSKFKLLFLPQFWALLQSDDKVNDNKEAVEISKGQVHTPVWDYLYRPPALKHFNLYAFISHTKRVAIQPANEDTEKKKKDKTMRFQSEHPNHTSHAIQMLHNEIIPTIVPPPILSKDEQLYRSLLVLFIPFSITDCAAIKASVKEKSWKETWEIEVDKLKSKDIHIYNQVQFLVGNIFAVKEGKKQQDAQREEQDKQPHDHENSDWELEDDEDDDDHDGNINIELADDIKHSEDNDSITLPWIHQSTYTSPTASSNDNIKHAQLCVETLKSKQVQLTDASMTSTIQATTYDYKGIDFSADRLDKWKKHLQTWAKDQQDKEETLLQQKEDQTSEVALQFVKNNGNIREMQAKLVATFRPTLNMKQEICFYIITDHIVKKIQDAKIQELIAITGPPGVGKSTVLTCVQEFAKQLKWGHHVQTTAYMHTAARQIQGITIHKLGQIPVPIKPSKHDVSKKKTETLEKLWKHIDILFVDEISMVSAEVLGYLSRSGQQAKHNVDKPFGGVTCIFFGDFYQIPDVSNNALYNKQSANRNAYAAAGYAIWQQLTGAILLEQIERSTDKNLTDILMAIRHNQPSYTHVQQLLQRVIQANETIPYPHIFITQRNIVRYNANIKFLTDFARTHEQIIYLIVAEDNFKKKVSPALQKHILHAMEHETSFVPGILPLVVGAPYIIKQNLYPELGITNYTTGTLEHVEFTDMEELHNKQTDTLQNVSYNIIRSMPKCIILRLHDVTLSQITDLPKPNLLPLQPETCTIQFQGKFMGQKRHKSFKRRQFPIIPGYAMTVNGAQGRTLPRILCDLNVPKRFPTKAANYVMLSRARTLNTIHLLQPCTLEDLENTHSKELQEELTRLHKVETKTLHNYEIQRKQQNSV